MSSTSLTRAELEAIIARHAPAPASLVPVLGWDWCDGCRHWYREGASSCEPLTLARYALALLAVVERVPEWRLLSMGAMSPASRYCTLCGAREAQGHATDCPWSGLKGEPHDHQ